ncbi:two-component sensor histidine kinase [Catellatospora methionotrophica]|uniref:Oxygen sensor histidine kinase NreB n=1 Tax=Catellatospora methionotrophica TaxID=121620 RepID=A0A8J3PI17_9ACTN|nr:sensor histidine kinase [Catellatospora methionotrophica]GIG16968.1 two-component sensor histidine kinase [Catellatospora methionotrophica]
MSRAGRGQDALTLLRRAEHVLFAALLAIGAGEAWADGVDRAAVLLTTLAVAVWYAVGMALSRRAAGVRMALLWLIVLTVGWTALLALSLSFVWLAFALYLLCLQLLPPRAGLPGTAALTAIAVAAAGAHRGGLDSGTVLGPVLGAAVAIVITAVYRRLRRESEARAALVKELTQAQERLAATERREGILAERERLAREIHDTVAQNLSSIILLLRSARDAADPGPPLEIAEHAARGALEDTRRLVRALAPAELTGRSLPEALERAVADARHFGVDARFVADGEHGPLPTPVAVALLRVTQAALANVRAHARAATVVVTLAFQPAAVRVDVADDGVGFDPRDPAASPSSGTGLGLSAMSSRLAEVGGVLVVESTPGEGTAISATVPLPPPRDPADTSPISAAAAVPVDATMAAPVPGASSTVTSQALS